MAKSSSIALLALLLAEGSWLDAQLLHPKDPMPSFEVATIKPWQPPPPSTGAPPPVKYVPVGAPAPIGDRISFTGEIQFLIRAAFGLSIGMENRILGGPGWIRDPSERFQVSAKIAPEDYVAVQKMSPAEQRRQVSWMQQSLLADRFKFAAHIEGREMPRYALVVTDGGSKLEPAHGETSLMSLAQVGQHVELRAMAVSMEELAQSPFIQIDQRQVVDKTGVPGRFNFILKFSSGMGGVRERVDVTDAPELPTALREQLGLRLVPETGPTEVIVIEHIERPSEN